MKKVFINGLSAIGAQPVFEGFAPEQFVLNTEETAFNPVQPSYKELIAPGAIRRMAKGVKMGIYTAHHALKEANNPELDAIIVGTGIGCIEDSEKFLNAIIDNDEEFLTPTSFIQSTHNTVAGQIALEMGCKAYNFTYVNGIVSLETSIQDALLQLQFENKRSILVGGVDETAPTTVHIYKKVDRIKEYRDDEDFVHPVSKGTVYSEGAAFFVLETEKKESSYAELAAVYSSNTFSKEAVEQLLAQHQLSFSDIDILFTGNDGSTQNEPAYLAFEAHFPESIHAMSKHLSGHYHTASGFALWSACHILKNQELPAVYRRNQLQKPKLETILIYNYDQGNHGLILLKAC